MRLSKQSNGAIMVFASHLLTQMSLVEIVSIQVSTLIYNLMCVVKVVRILRMGIAMCLELRSSRDFAVLLLHSIEIKFAVSM